MADIASEIVSGDDVALQVQLTKGGVSFSISSEAVVQAAIVSFDRGTVLVDAVEQSPTADGADWDNSLVTVEFSSAVTAGITQFARSWLEIQVYDEGKKRTWFSSVGIDKGNID